MNFDLKSWLTGFALGLVGKPLPLAVVQKMPVAYLYNGVRLPELPEWDKETYPYAVIAKVFSSEPLYYAFFCADKCSVGSEAAYYAGPHICYSADGEEWEFLWEEQDNYTPILSSVTPIWANHDVLHENGTVYISTSAPTPVYE